jgi:hypothetical protein
MQYTATEGSVQLEYQAGASSLMETYSLSPAKNKLTNCVHIVVGSM